MSIITHCYCFYEYLVLHRVNCHNINLFYMKLKLHYKLILITKLIVLSSLLNKVQAQNYIEPSYVHRSTLSTSAPFSSEPSTSIVQQCVGQSSVIGSYESDAFNVSQGFVQSFMMAPFTQSQQASNLKVNVYPNPCVDVLHVSFLEPPHESVYIQIFNSMGVPLKHSIYDPKHKIIVIDMNHLMPANYFIKIATSSKQYIKHIHKF